MDIISFYTSEQAEEDGIFFDICYRKIINLKDEF